MYFSASKKFHILIFHAIYFKFTCNCDFYSLDFMHLSLKIRVIFAIIFVNSRGYGCPEVCLRYLAATEILNY